MDNLQLGIMGIAALAESGGDFYFGDVGQAVITIIIFVGLLIVLGRFAWKPIVNQLERREKSIAQSLEQAQQRHKQAESLLEEYKARLDAAAAQAQELLNQARQQAAAAREEVIAAAQAEAHKVSESARGEIERAKLEAVNELYDATARLAAEIAATLIRKNLTADDQQRLMKDSLAEIRTRTAEARK